MNCRYLYQSHGAEIYHRMTLLSIESLRRLGVPGERIHVITDTPDFFAPLGVEVMPVNAATLRGWRGRFRFVHRAKLGAMILFRETFPDDAMVYADSDTVWVNPIGDFPRPFVHVLEPEFSHKYLTQYRALLTKGGFYPGQALRMYNAGLIGLPASFPLAGLKAMLKATDWLCLHTPSRMNWAEQLAVAAELESRGTLDTREADLIHYWTNSVDFLRLTKHLSTPEFARLTLEEVAAYRAKAKPNRKAPMKRKLARSLGKRVNDVKAAYWRFTGSHDA